MKADVSRLTFDAAKRYSAVVAQQGRVQLDADWNERDAIQAYLARTEAVDVIGTTGVPKEGGGFAVTVTSDGADLEISAGRMYVEGLLCESAPTAVALTGRSKTSGEVATWRVDGRDLAAGDRVDVTVVGADPVTVRVDSADRATRMVTFDAPVPGLSQGTAALLRRRVTLGSQPDAEPVRPDAPGRYAVYVDVWERLLTTLDDPEMGERALGQAADTTGRLKVVWQAGLARVGDLGVGDCDTAAWRPAEPTGTLAVRLDPLGGDEGPCVLPPSAGYTGLEHQLYRIEVHEPGKPGSGATFTWQRDNASVVALLEDLGTDVVVSDVGRDEHLGFSVGDLVEASDDGRELAGLPGELLEVTDMDRAARVLTLDRAPTVDPDRNPKLRRWDGQGQIVVAAGEDGWIDLEHGVQVRFGDGEYRTGDYWLVPARAATSTDTGDVEWPRADDGTPLPAAPHGVRHRYAALALVDFDGNVFRPAVLDCRALFPPLTAITADDVSYAEGDCKLGGATTVQEAIDALCERQGRCTVVVQPGKRWYAPLLDLAPGQDAEICFPVGDFVVDRVVTLRGLGSVLVTGSGPGSRLVARAQESVLAFEDCESVTVRDLTAVGGTAGDRRGAAHLNGALSFRGCGDVAVESVVASCESRAQRGATCVTVGAGEQGAPVRSVRVTGCRLDVGQFQTGLLVWDARRVWVEDNEVEVRVAPKAELVPLGRNVVLQDAIRAMLMPRSFAVLAQPSSTDQPAKVTKAQPAEASPNQPRAATGRTDKQREMREASTHEATTDSGEKVEFTSSQESAPVWRAILADAKYQRMSSPSTARTEYARLARRIARGDMAEGGSEIARFIASIQRRMPPVAMQGIVVGGRVAEDVRIVDNVVAGVLQGIHVGLSDQTSSADAPLSAGRVVISRNTVSVVLPPIPVRARHGIFVGNCTSLLVDDNRLAATRPRGDKRSIEGIRVWGVLGRMAFVRANHISGFTVGITFAPLGEPSRTKNQWAVEDNLAESASPAVAIPEEQRPRVREARNVA